ncbi:hypothetical protein H8S90_02195 [Olivibacter sp. SDN3]|uniref:hypothetical protein n=1 Tax=Olivibacter sp. SDN3 TaxID=2764720 RepID=UPI001650FDA3|nr:hypothetical protein [Olivibacter sp. SDN3]QNL50454.1 hypothetical protein H8S90_02195 [Olivibacter sp. SDN3]
MLKLIVTGNMYNKENCRYRMNRRVKKTIPWYCNCCFMLFFSLYANGQPVAATDGLGRSLPQQDEVGSPKLNRQVALFYFLWQGDPSSGTSEKCWDLDEIYTGNPAVFENFDHPGWGGGAAKPGKYYFWGQSIYGYYHGSDYWVHLKNIQLLTDAGVDLLVIDATNRLTYPQQSDALMRAMEAVRKQGKNPPKIAFYTHTASGEAMEEIYNNCYKEGAPYRHPDCWFYLDGKPLIIGLSEEAAGKAYSSFFTVRESQWPNEPGKVNGWPWIEFERPQKVYLNSKGVKEIVNVSAAQHPNLEASMGGSAFYGQPGNWGRSYRNGSPGNPEADLKHGYNIQEQWEFALKQEVPFIFVTGWNEWIAGKWRRGTGNKNHALFVDQASPEYSRDLEPSLTAGLEDHYYMQLVSYIRRYKGVDTLPTLSPMKTIHTWNDWDDVYPTYHDYTGDILHRDYRGAPSEPAVTYINKTGRNDFKLAKVAQDRENIYFYMQTVDKITPKTDNDWMTLWVDIDRSHRSGWYGYDYRVIAGDRLQCYTDGRWQDVARISYKIENNQFMIAIPLKLLGLSDKLDLAFKWSDNMQEEHPLDWYVNGDAAPGGRFNFVALRD